jgi:hypothetical protein
MSQFICFGKTVTSQNLIQEEIERRLNSDNALLLFSPELSVFSVTVKEYKN